MWDAPGFGNCLFEAATWFITDVTAAQLRQRATAYIQDRKSFFAESVADVEDLRCYRSGNGHVLVKPTNFEEYCAQMFKEGTWGGEPEITAILQAFKRAVVVYSDNADHHYAVHDTDVSCDDPIVLKHRIPGVARNSHIWAISH